MAFESFQHQAQFPTVDHVDNELVDKIVNKLKSQGIFDQFRKDCLADVDTKPAYQHLQQRVNGSVSGFLKKNQWKQDLNKTQLRESLRHHVQQGFLQAGVDRIVDQVVNSKIYSVFMPKVEDIVYETLGIEKPKRPERVKPIGTSLAPKVESPVNTQQNEKPAESTPSEQQPKTSQSPMSLLPKGLDPISPPSDIEDVDRDDSNTIDETPFLLASLKQKETAPPPHSEVSNDSKLSGISELSSHGSRIEISSTTNSIVPKTPTKISSNQKLDNFSNLSEKLKQFDPLNKTTKNTLSDSKKANDNRCSEDDVSSTSATLPVVESESNGYNRDDSNAELERQLMSEDSKSSLTDFKKFKSLKVDLKFDNANKTEEDSSINDSNLESKKSRTAENKKSDNSKGKDPKMKCDRKECSSSKDKDRKRTEKKDFDKKDTSKSSRHSSSKSHDYKRSDESSKHRSDKKDEKISSSRDKSKDDKHKLKDDKHRSEKKLASEKKDHKKDDDKESKEKKESDKTKSSKDSKKREHHHKSNTSDKDKSKHKTTDKKTDDKHKEEDNKKDKDEVRKKRDEEKKKEKSKKEDPSKEKEKLSRKRKGERCSEVKSKESRRSSDRDNSGSGHNSKKSSHPTQKSSSEKTSSSKHKEHGQSGNGPQDADEGLSEVDLILMKINSSIEEEEFAMAPLKKTKFAKNAHEVKKIINAKRNLERQKRNSLLDSSINEESHIDNKENLHDHITHQNIKGKEEETQLNEIKPIILEKEIKYEETVDKSIENHCAVIPEKDQEDIKTVEMELLTENNMTKKNQKDDCTENKLELTKNKMQDPVCNSMNNNSDIIDCSLEKQKEEISDVLSASTSVIDSAVKSSIKVENTKSDLMNDNEINDSSCSIENISESENQPLFLGFDSECIAIAKQQLLVLNNLVEKMRSSETHDMSSDDELDNNLNNLRSSRLRKRKNCDATNKAQRNIRKTIKGNNGCVSLRTSDDNDCPENCLSPIVKSPDNSLSKPLSNSLTEGMLNNLLKESNISEFQNREDDEEDAIRSKTVIKSARNVKCIKNDKTEKKEKCSPDGKTLSPAHLDKRRRPRRSSARSSAQRYDSTDLYKPRAVAAQSSRRSRALNESTDKSDRSSLEKKRLR